MHRGGKDSLGSASRFSLFFSTFNRRLRPLSATRLIYSAHFSYLASSNTRGFFFKDIADAMKKCSLKQNIQFNLSNQISIPNFENFLKTNFNIVLNFKQYIVSMPKQNTENVVSNVLVLLQCC